MRLPRQLKKERPKTMAKEDKQKIERALDAALSALPHFFNKDGGWGYQGGEQSFLEPTSFVVLALLSQKEKFKRLIDEGCSFIKSCRHKNGSWGIQPGDSGGTWMVAQAILALYAARHTEEALTACQYLLTIDDGYRGIINEEMKRMNIKIFRLDITAHGWPYTPGTASWVEPTAYALLALCRCGYPLVGRPREAIRYLETRQATSGGWNYGNPWVFDKAFPPFPLPTTAALLSLKAANFPKNYQPCRRGLEYLQGAVPRLVSHRSIALTALCLAEYGDLAHREILLNQLCLDKAGWLSRKDPLVTALACLAFKSMLGGDPFGA